MSHPVATTPSRIGLFGGSFNPVHLGHLLVARAACEELSLDRVFFIPAARSPFKPDLELASAPERLRLLRLALAGQTWCEVDDLEVRRGGVSYTIETVAEYQRRFPGTQLSYLIGADHVPLLPTWREAVALASRVRFVVVPRPGEAYAPFPKPFQGIYLRGFPADISASAIRKRIQSGLPIDHLVPSAVAEAIRNNRLYL